MPKAKSSVKRTNTRDARSKKTTTVRDPKASHLYTDDNPSTTIHGTGFKDREAALRTLNLISKRSLTYQFQTVNTMYYRAKHHTAMKKQDVNSNISDAMSIFRHWLDDTYLNAKESLRCDGGFKPLLSKSCVQKYLDRIDDMADSELAQRFAHVYVDLPKGKRLGNTLVDQDKPTEPDWERARYDTLCKLVPDDHTKLDDWPAEALWNMGDKKEGVTIEHLQLIAWAWSPASEKQLL